MSADTGTAVVIANANAAYLSRPRRLPAALLAAAVSARALEALLAVASSASVITRPAMCGGSVYTLPSKVRPRNWA